MSAYDFSAPRDDAELDAISRSQSWAFSVPAEESRQWLDRWGADAFRVLREDGRVAASYKHVEMGQWFGGCSVPLVGVAAVSVPPENRGNRSAARLMEAAVLDMHERRVPISALYPATQSLYRQSGYDIAGSRCEIRADLALIGGAKEDVQFIPIGEPDEPVVETLYRAQARLRDGYLDRGRYVWYRIRNPHKVIVRGFLALENGAAAGYLYLTQKAGELGISDMCLPTPTVARAALRFLRSHGTILKEAVWHGPAADPLLLEIREQSWQVKLQYRFMIRIVDVERACTARGYASTTRGELHFELRDELLPANAGPWVIEVADGAARVQRGGRADMVIDARGLASLYSGYMPAETLRAAGRLEADDRTCAIASGLFAGGVPSMPDFF